MARTAAVRRSIHISLIVAVVLAVIILLALRQYHAAAALVPKIHYYE